MSKKRILITGAGSGFGEGAAIGLAQNGHDVIAGAQIWPQVTSLRQKVKSLGLNNLRVEKLDLLHPYDVDHALKWDIDILFSNAGIGENGPVCEIPVDLVRRTFEINVFAPLELAQKFIRKWVDQKRPGKVVFTSSVAGAAHVGYGSSPLCREQACSAMHRRVASARIEAIPDPGTDHQSEGLPDRVQ
jgi:NAD(P)-dependent dehydrogenase (short-subunit alcohol dehydrogenase family)